MTASPRRLRLSGVGRGLCRGLLPATIGIQKLVRFSAAMEPKL
jgi:hypothetical protein